MGRPAGAAQDARQFRDRNGRHVLQRARIDFGDRRREQHIQSGGFQLAGILGQRARIAGEVLVGAELGRVDENAGDGARGLLAGAFDQMDVATVQVPHGGHESHSFSRLPPGGDLSAQFGDGVDSPHQDAP